MTLKHRVMQVHRATLSGRRSREVTRAYLAAFPEEVLAKAELYRAKRRAYARDNVVMLAGERVRIQSLPEELQPIARLIKETRREIKKGRAA